MAARQHGNLTRQQLLGLGLGAEAVKHRVRSGRLYRVHLGVYAVGRPPKTALERAAAAVLACGPRAALAAFPAMSLWALAKQWPDRMHVATPARRRPAGVVVHRTTTLVRRDIRTHLGIRVTSPARTLLDCAPLLSDTALTRAVNDARLAGLLTPAALQDVLARNPHHRGRPRLAALIGPTKSPTRSAFEDAFLTFCVDHDLPSPQLNVHVAGYEVDALFQRHKLIVELDGYRYHSDRDTFERDRRRDADTLAAGFATVRVTWQRMTQEPDSEAARLGHILDQR